METTAIKRTGFWEGVRSIVAPYRVNVRPYTVAVRSDVENIASDWRRVGSYISKSYGEAIKRSQARAK